MNLPEWPKAVGTKKRGYNLSNIKAIMDAAKNPHLKLPPILHIAGTNGKGSTTAYLKSIFEESGYKVHCYTSPHLIEFNERIYLSSSGNISNEELELYLDRIENICKGNNISPSFFDGTTAAAFLAFAEHKADVLILETGLGGRLDSTNIVPCPFLSIITPISYDHMEYLGSRITDIAREKAGIIKESISIIGPQTNEAMQVVKTHLKNKAYIFGENFFLDSKNNRHFTLKYKDNCYQIKLPSLNGGHQVQNAAVCAMAAIAASKQFQKITINSISVGISKAYIPGRLQLIPQSKIKKFNIKNLWVDGAHNPDAARVISQSVAPNSIILGMMANRDIKEFLKYFDKNILIYAVSIPNLDADLYNVDIIKKEAEKAGFKAYACSNIEEAFYKANGNVLATGSLYITAEILKYMKKINP